MNGENPDPDRSELRRAAARRKYRWWINALLLVAILTGIAGLGQLQRPGPPSLPSPGPPSLPNTPGTYIVDQDELRAHVDLAARGVEPYRSALSQLITTADATLDTEAQPEEPLRTDEPTGPFLTDTRNAHALALAYAATGDRRYADKAAELITAWVNTTRSTENSCVDSGACPTSLLVSRHAPGFVFAATLIAGSDALEPAERADFGEWLRTVILPVTSERTNNWGDAGTFARLVITDYIGDDQGFNDALDDWRRLMDLVEPTGEIPEETRRGRSGMTYTQGALTLKLAAASIAQRRSVDLWSYEGARGGTLKSAVDLLARYWVAPDQWPYHDRVTVPTASPMWELAYARWQDPDYAPVLDGKRPFGDEGNSALGWTTLTTGIPLSDAS